MGLLYPRLCLKVHAPLLLRFGIRRTGAPNAAANQIGSATSTSTIVIRVSISFASARGEERRGRSTRGLRAVAARIEADGARAKIRAGRAIVVEERDVAAGHDTGGLTSTGANDLWFGD